MTRSVSSSLSMVTLRRLPVLRVERGHLELVGGHLAEALEARDVRLRVALGLLLEDPVAVRARRAPSRSPCRCRSGRAAAGRGRRAVLDERPQVPVEEGQQQRGDVVAVAVGVHQQEDLAVAQLGRGRSPAPMPQPSALTMSCSSLLPAPCRCAACSALSTLPRSGRIAWVRRSRPCLAEPPAESPSTMNSSLSLGSVDAQSASLPGRFSRWLTAVLRLTACDAARLRLAGARRQDDARRRPPRRSLLFSLSHFSSAGRTTPSTWPATSGLLSRSLVWPWNCGSRT